MFLNLLFVTNFCFWNFTGFFSKSYKGCRNWSCKLTLPLLSILLDFRKIYRQYLTNSHDRLIFFLQKLIFTNNFVLISTLKAKKKFTNQDYTYSFRKQSITIDSTHKIVSANNRGLQVSLPHELAKYKSSS